MITSTHNKNIKKSQKDPLKMKKKSQYIKQIWTDTKPPADNSEAYKSCEIRLENIEKQIAYLDSKYLIDDNNLLGTIKYYATHLERLRISEGLTDFKSSKSIIDTLNGIKSQGMTKALMPMLKSTRQDIIQINDEKIKEAELTRMELSRYFEPAKKNEAIRLPSINQREKSSKNLTLTKITLAPTGVKKINDDNGAKSEISTSKENTPENKNHADEIEIENQNEIESESEYESDENFDDFNLDTIENDENILKQNENERKIDIPLSPSELGTAKVESPTLQ